MTEIVHVFFKECGLEVADWGKQILMRLGISQYEQIVHDRLRQIGLVVFVRRGSLVNNVVSTTCATGLANVYGKTLLSIFVFNFNFNFNYF